MDGLTHALTGLAMSRAGFGKWTPGATAVLVLAAMAPDIDFVSVLWGGATSLRYHRHFTHTLLFAPMLAVLPVLVVWLITRRRAIWKRAYPLALLGIGSHILLDITNMYGIRPLMPFSNRWINLDITGVFDLWIWAVMLIMAFAPVLSRLVNQEIGARPGTGQTLAVAALLFLTGYNAFRYVLHGRAVSVMESRLHGGERPLRVAAMPDPVNPFAWRGLVETEPFYMIHDVNLRDEFDPREGRTYYKPELNPQQAMARKAAMQTEPFQIFLDFSQFPLWRLQPADETEGATLVEVADIRFGDPFEGSFTARALVANDGTVKDAWFSYRHKQSPQPSLK